MSLSASLDSQGEKTASRTHPPLGETTRPHLQTQLARGPNLNLEESNWYFHTTSQQTTLGSILETGLPRDSRYSEEKMHLLAA